MPLTPQQAFKAGVLRECAMRGLNQSETIQAIKSATQQIKTAGLTDLISKPVSQAVSSFGNAAGSAATGLGQVGLAGLLLGPPAIGLGAGYAASKLTDVDEEDVRAVKKRDLIAEYRRQAARIKQRRKSYRIPVK